MKNQYDLDRIDDIVINNLDASGLLYPLIRMLYPRHDVSIMEMKADRGIEIIFDQAIAWIKSCDGYYEVCLYRKTWGDWRAQSEPHSCHICFKAETLPQIIAEQLFIIKRELDNDAAGKDMKVGMIVELKDYIAKEIGFPKDSTQGMILGVYPEHGGVSVFHKCGIFNWAFNELFIPEPEPRGEQWLCKCNYFNFGVICTKCGRGRGEQ